MLSVEKQNYAELILVTKVTPYHDKTATLAGYNLNRTNRNRNLQNSRPIWSSKLCN